jgi:ActR/RegA family two-component response regulator
MQKIVLILDDQENIRKDLYRYLGFKDYIVKLASNQHEAKEFILNSKIDFALVDLKIDYISEFGGIKVIFDINKHQPQTKVIILSAYEINDLIEEKLSGAEYYGYISKGGKMNYIEAVIEKLKEIENIEIKKKCFVIMPFNKTKKCNKAEWLEIFETLIKPSVENSGYNYFCHRTNLKIGNIIEDILDNLNKADVVIADLTDKNVNVYYELGVRHALRNATILITQSIDDVPHDLRSYALIKYDWKTKRDKDEFAVQIKNALDDVENNSKNIISPVQKYLSNLI